MLYDQECSYHSYFNIDIDSTMKSSRSIELDLRYVNLDMIDFNNYDCISMNIDI